MPITTDRYEPCNIELLHRRTISHTMAPPFSGLASVGLCLFDWNGEMRAMRRGIAEGCSVSLASCGWHEGGAARREATGDGRVELGVMPHVSIRARLIFLSVLLLAILGASSALLIRELAHDS